MSKIYKVFLSSTFADLKEERYEVIAAMLQINCVPVAMEFFPAVDETAEMHIKRQMDDCDYFVLIVASRYGYLDPDSDRSYTQMEYEYAVAKGLPIIAFLIDDTVVLAADKRESEASLQQRLANFVALVKEGRVIRHWTNSANLCKEIIISLLHTMTVHPQLGYERQNDQEVTSFDAVERQNQKLGYIKFMHLTRREPDNSNKPVYQRYIPRLRKLVDVFDEYVLFRINDFPVVVDGFECRDITTGVVDLSILNPWQSDLYFPEGLQHENDIKQRILRPSKVFTTASTYYNAFQLNQELMIKMERPTRRARLIIDFSSFPNHRQAIKPIDAYLRTARGEQRKLTIVDRFPPLSGVDTGKAERSSGRYWISEDNVGTGDVMGIRFKIFWSKL